MKYEQRKRALTEKDKEFCVVAGCIGLGISLVCLFQYFYMITSFEPEAVGFCLPFLFCVVTFSMLIARHFLSPLFLIISTVQILFYFGFLYYLFLGGIVIFSVLFVLLFFYLVAITVFIYIKELPGKMKHTRELAKAESKYWESKL